MENFGRRSEDHGQESPIVILTEIRSDLKNMIKNHEKHEIEDDKRFTKLEIDVDSLKTDRAKIWGGAGAIAVVAAWLMKIIR